MKIVIGAIFVIHSSLGLASTVLSRALGEGEGIMRVEEYPTAHRLGDVGQNVGSRSLCGENSNKIMVLQEIVAEREGFEPSIRF